MNYNASIRWHSGMRLSAEHFSQFQEDMTLRQQMVIRLALLDGRYGILPETPLNLEGTFVRKTYEMTGLQCTAILPSGRLLSVNGDLSLPINLPNEDADYYLTLGLGNEKREYERDGVEYAEPDVVIEMHTLNEIEALDVLPVKHLIVENGVLKQDAKYIIPVLTCSQDERLEGYLRQFVESIDAITNHPNMDEGDCKKHVSYAAFRMRDFNMRNSITELLKVVEEAAQVLDFYIFQVNGKKISEIPATTQKLHHDHRRKITLADITIYLEWFSEYVASLTQIMERVVIEKPTIDIDAIKKEIHDALYTELHDSLYDEIVEKVKTQVMEELPEPIVEKIRQYITDDIQPEMRTLLRDDLRDPLYNDLYDALCKMLQDMLANFEFKQPDTFVPLI